jgi:dCMP deaminase
MKIAKVVATRSTCEQLQVGAIVVKDRTIVSTGYNGAISGMAHCAEAGHEMENGHSRTVHAEMNAVAQAAKNGVLIDGSEIYVTNSPCWNCFKLIANSGIRTIYYETFYKDSTFFDAAKECGIKVVHLLDKEV